MEDLGSFDTSAAKGSNPTLDGLSVVLDDITMALGAVGTACGIAFIALVAIKEIKGANQPVQEKEVKQQQYVPRQQKQIPTYHPEFFLYQSQQTR
ncbi:MAG: hypothetical protein J6W40_00215 [Alphaproteobacteria bacterium]|nr:hypothetical protein [Alphaproteobacteria bacterium]